MADTVDILFVDDDADDAELIAHALRATDKAVGLLHLKSGREALEFIFGEGSSTNTRIRPGLKLVMLDLKIGMMSGLEVLKKIRADPRTKSLPVIVLSSSRESRDITQAYALGANSYVVKPVGFEKFVKAISTLACYWSEVNVRPPVEHEKVTAL